MSKHLKRRNNEVFKFKSRKKRQKFMIEFRRVNQKDFPFFLKNLDSSSRKVPRGTPLMVLAAEKGVKKAIASIASNFGKTLKEFQENRKAIEEAMLKEDTEKLPDLLRQKSRISFGINAISGAYGNGERLY